LVVKHLESLKEQRDYQSREDLIDAAKIALSSKVVSSCKNKLAEIAVDAILHVADLERKEVNLELIKIVGKTG
jgi:T-complex protein 1 subunit epsilon